MTERRSPVLHPQRPPRYPLRLRAEVTRAQGAAHANVPQLSSAWTQNVSGHGLFLELGSPLEPGSKLRVRLELPASATSERVLVDCRCRVVRVALQKGTYGIGALIEEYQFIREPQRVESAE